MDLIGGSSYRQNIYCTILHKEFREFHTAKTYRQNIPCTDKCIYITASQRISSVCFSPTDPGQGKLVPRKSSAAYLGTILSDSFSNKAELLNRLGDCTATANRMKLFWNKANTSIRWRIQVFNAIIRLKLLYGLERINAEICRLNSFQNKSLRRILGKPPTFIDRSETNERMYREIQEHYGCNFEHFGDTWPKAKLKLFGHILRSSRADPLSQVTFASDPLHPRLVYTRRPGRPKADWVWESYKNAFMLIDGQGALFNPNDIEHLRQVKTEALRRKFWSFKAWQGYGLSSNPCGISATGCTVLSTVCIPF